MVDIESVLFLKLIREKSLRHPTARQFDRAAWIEAAKALKHPSERDQQLLIAAVHYGDEIASLRVDREEKLFEGLNRRMATLLSLAMVNYNYAIVTEKAKKNAKGRMRDKVVHLGLAGGQTVASAFPGNESTPDTIIATIVDTLPHCLERADKLPADLPVGVVNYWDRGSALFAVMSVEHSLRGLWQRVLWEGWKIQGDGTALRQCPVDRHLATLWEVWIWRQEMLLSQGANLDAMREKTAHLHGKTVEPIISPTVVGIGGSSRDTRSFRFGEIAGRVFSQSWHRTEHAVLEDSYLAQFLDAPLPRLANALSCRDLQKAWCIVRDCAQILAAKSKSRKFESLDSIEALALLIRRSELERALVQCAGFSEERAKTTIDYFTCDLSNLTNLFTKGFWAAPLVGIDDGTNIAMVLPSLAVGSAIRRVENWLDRGGLSDHLSNVRRGIKYEAWIRSELCDGLTKNVLLPNARCATNPIARPKNEGEQIDLLIVLGDLLIVGEVKCFLYPIESSEHYDYLRKLNDAGDQAARKAKWLVENPAEIVRALGISMDRAATLRPVPIVVINQGAGFSLKANGSRIVDFHFLNLYLSVNEYVAGMAIEAKDQRAVQQVEILYRNEAEAAGKFEENMETPVPLKRYLNSAEWKDNQFPMSNGQTMLVENCLLGEKMAVDAEKLASILKN